MKSRPVLAWGLKNKRGKLDIITYYHKKFAMQNAVGGWRVVRIKITEVTRKKRGK